LDESTRETQLVGERLHHRTNAEELFWVADADNSFSRSDAQSPI